jgi:hypothetical protein
MLVLQKTYTKCISSENSEFSSASLSGTDIALPNSKAQPAGFWTTPQLTHLALSGTSIRRKRHISVMSIEISPYPGMYRLHQQRRDACAPNHLCCCMAYMPPYYFCQGVKTGLQHRDSGAHPKIGRSTNCYTNSAVVMHKLGIKHGRNVVLVSS